MCGIDDQIGYIRYVFDIQVHTLTPVLQTEICKTKFFDIVFQGSALRTGVRFGNERLERLEVLARNRSIKNSFSQDAYTDNWVVSVRNIMIDCC